MNKKLKKLFYPHSIAVIGASKNPQKVGGILMNKLNKFEGEIIPINPKHNFISNKKTYSSVLKYKKKIDLVIIATPKETVILVLKECAKKKIKNIIIITSGFSEIGNTKEESQIIEISKKYKLNILGPNCFGIVNTELNLDTTFSSSIPMKGTTAFVSQSGALWSYISELNIGFSKFVSLGNMSDISFSDIIKYLNNDKKTKKIVCYIEKLKDGKEFIKVCKKSKKEIIVVKAGKTKMGESSAVSHTGSLATDYNVYKGAFKQAKVKHVESLTEAFNINLPEIKIKNKSKTAIITNAGGAGVLVTDYVEQRGIKIEKVLDILGTANAEDYKKALTKFSKIYKHIIVILTPQKMSEPEKTANVITKFKKLKITTFFLGDKSIRESKKILEKNKIKCYTRI